MDHSIDVRLQEFLFRAKYTCRAILRASWVALITHSKLESTVRYLGIDVDDALEMAEQTDV